MVLDLEPSGTVAVSITPDSQVTRSPTSLSFTTGNWSTPQTVTVTAVNDATVEGNHSGTITHSASGGSYDSVSISSVVANITDDDTAGSEQLEYRWYANADSASPGAALAAQDIPLAGGTEGTSYHLRMGVKDSVVDLNPGQAFKLQYATSQSGPWTDVGAAGSAEVWRGYDNPSEADGATIPTSLLSFATILETYEETNDSASTPAKIDTSKAAEWAWLVQANSPSPNTTYYFRMVRDIGTPLETYTVYPELAIGGVGVTITPNNGGGASLESVASYAHTVTNTGAVVDTIDITTASTAGWSVALFQSDGVTPLADSDADTMPDTGSLAPSGFVDIVVKVTVGWNTTSDVTTVTASSSVDTNVQNSATDTTTAPSTITVTISDTSAEFGSNLDPSGVGSNSSDSVVAYASSGGVEGAYYVWRDQSGAGLTVTVKSNLPWSGTTIATENTGTSPSMTVASGVWRYSEGSEPASYTDCAGATVLTLTAATWKSSVPAGINPYTHYHCLRIDWIDDPGGFVSSLTYEVTQL